MRKVLLILVAILCLVAAGYLLLGSRPEARASAAPAVFNGPRFITSMIGSATVNVNTAAMAAHRGQYPETRELGAIVHRSSTAMREDLIRLAAQRHIPIPAAPEERLLALQQNLQTLAPPTFDQAYVFAVLQQSKETLESFDAAARSGDRDLAQFVEKYRPVIVERQSYANHAMGRMGGTPWGLSP